RRTWRAEWCGGSGDVCRCLPFCLPLLVRKPLRDGFGEVGFVDDVIAVEHRPRLPAAELHDLTLRHAATTEVTGSRAPEVVHEPAFQPGLFTCALPDAPEAVDALAAPVKD